ncbi:MAG: glycosyltransferase [Candidatus Gottesmanbacteria bacterium]
MYKQVFIATFSLWKNGKRTAINGMVEPLLSFFLPRVNNVTILDGPHPGSDRIKSFVEIYEKGKYIKKSDLLINLLISPLLIRQNENNTQISFKIRDLLSVIEYGLKSRKKFDLFIGLESIFTLAGIILKKLGIVKTVIYYVSDYSPKRYPQRFLNNIYLILDRLCCYHADYIWDVSPAIQPARIKAGLNIARCVPEILVPNALFKQQICPLPYTHIQPLTLVFAGTFGPENGLNLAIGMMRKIIKYFPGAILHIFGGGPPPESELKTLVKNYQLQQNVVFHGFIDDAAKLSGLINKFSIGIAPYRAFADSARWFGDATKIRLYFGAGLPVITTQVPPLGKEITKSHLGLVVNDNENDLVSAVINVFRDQKLYQQLRNNAINYAKSNTWDNSYKKALDKITS